MPAAKVRVIKNIADVDPNAIYSVTEVARLLHRSPDTIRKECAGGFIPSYKAFGKYTILGRSLLELFGSPQRLYTEAELERIVAQKIDQFCASFNGKVFSTLMAAARGESLG